MGEIDWGAIRGPLTTRRMSARSTAALLDNPGCQRRAVLDAAMVDVASVAGLLGHATQFGQSPFALGQGNRFEQRVKADGYAQLVEVLREVGFDLPDTLTTLEVTTDRSLGMQQALDARVQVTRDALAAIARPTSPSAS